MTYLEKVALLGNNATQTLESKLTMNTDIAAQKRHYHTVARDVVTAAEAADGIINLAFTYVMGNDSLIVLRNGNLVDITTDYTETTTSRITFVAGVLYEGDTLKFLVRYSGVEE